jgi:transposase
MRKIKEVLRLNYDAHLSSRKIAKSCNISPATVQKILKAAEAAGISWPLPEGLDDTALENRLYIKPNICNINRPAPDPEYIYRELKKKHVTLTLLWDEYRKAHHDGLMYSQYCEHYRKWRGSLDICMHQDHKAGEKLFVDWAGDTFPIANRETGEIDQSYLFLATLGASSYSYGEGFFSRDLPQWITANVHAFAHFQGVTEIVVPDNLKTGVSKPNYYEPDINPTYQSMAEYYGTVIIPARVRHGDDKALVEKGVKDAETWVLAALRNHTFFSLAEFNRAVMVKMAELNDKPFQKMEGSRRTLFETIDRPALKPLPSEPYELAEWTKARVNVDCHVQCSVDKNFYSVPYQLVKQLVELRVTANMVEIIFKGQRVFLHHRAPGKYVYVTEPSHLPERHQKYLEWTPERIVSWAGTVGPNTAALATEIMNSKAHVEQGYRACLGVMRLAKSYPAERMEAAAKRALSYKAVSYKSFKSILDKGLDQAELPAPSPEVIIQHENIRGSAYYQQGGDLN